MRKQKIPRGTGTSVLKSRAIDFKKKDFQLKSRSNRVYVKLKTPLSKSVVARLKKKGIKLNEYVTDATYVISIDQDKLDLLKDMRFIQGFEHIQPTDKISERLYKSKIGNYAREGNNVTPPIFDKNHLMCYIINERVL
ncbi:MAG: hypothetical protein H7A34_07955 [bacterium]|nr:hypothetical protein [bacterium]